ncbi:DUF2946 domain-containing protein [Paraburkholderia sp. C35]|uniref:DUF2946 domain-containing protein n=1 Tax=Paraburkholderia sp. C35 TaxID=2126993 RepID=UPI000D690AD2|nr:DUF2946 domain-containing protein [Paraburkholderia sp. C35]
MRSRFFRFTGSFIGLLAILMATLAPTISHSLAAMHGGGESGMHCSMPSMQHDAGQDASHTHTSMPGGDACGYCSLLAHMPAVVAPQLVFTQIIQVVLQRIATRFESVRLVEPLAPGQPRAPPFRLS